jgi:hypothetical protein
MLQQARRLLAGPVLSPIVEADRRYHPLLEFCAGMAWRELAVAGSQVRVFIWKYSD